MEKNYGEWLNGSIKEVQTAHKVAQNWVAKSDSRPVLTGVHARDGWLIATDSHRLIKMQVPSHIEEPFTITKDHVLLEGNYPDTARLIPYQECAASAITLSTKDKELIALLKATIATENAKYASIDIVVTQTDLIIRPSHSRIHLKLEYMSVNTFDTKQIAKYEDFVITLNAKYFLDLLQDVKRLGQENVHMYYYDKHKPVLFKTGDKDQFRTTAVILPIRKG